MVLLSAFIFQTPAAIQGKAEKGIFGVQVEDHIESGFAIGGGKYLVTSDHVVGSTSTITVLEPKSKSRKGYLVFHDLKMNVAVYRMDRLSPYSFSFNNGLLKPSTRFFVISPTTRMVDGGVPLTGEISSVDSKSDTGQIRFSAPIGIVNRGGPIINFAGEVIGMIQDPDSTSKDAFFGITSARLSRFLRDQANPPVASTVIGNLGQALDRTVIYSTASADSSPLFMTSRNQYLVVSDFSPEFLKVTLPNGGVGYVPINMVSIVARNITLGDYGVANGREVIRAVQAIDAESIRPTSSEAEWRAETIRFVGSIFETAGREISEDISVQLDIGRSVATVDDLKIGDRIYFGKGSSLWGAIYLGDGQYISVSRAGKLVTMKFADSNSKPFFRALH